MLEKGVEELLPTMLGNERGRDFLSKVVNIMRDEVGHLAVFGVPPGMINDIEFGGIGREELYVHPVPIDLSEQTGGFFVPTEAVPDDEQRALEMASQLLDKRKDIVSGDVPRRDGEIETQTLLHRRQGDGAGYREAIVSVQLAWTGGAPWSPGAAHRGLQHETGLVNKDNSAPFTPGFFYPGPVLAWPFGNRLLITFTSPSLGLLGAPLESAHEVPHTRGTISDAKVALNDGGDARQRPEFIPKAMGASPLAKSSIRWWRWSERSLG